MKRELTKRNTKLLDSLKKNLTDEYTTLMVENLTDYLLTQVNNVSSIEEASIYISNLVHIDNQIRGLDLLNPDGASLTNILKYESEAHDKLKVTYGGNYMSFSDVLNDFKKQTNLTTRAFSEKAHISTTTITDFSTNKYAENINPTNRRKKGLELSRNKILDQFNINPRGSLEKIIELPMFHEVKNS